MPAFFAIAALLGVIVFALMLRPLWKESRALGRYDMVLFACECGEQRERKGERANEAANCGVKESPTTPRTPDTPTFNASFMFKFPVRSSGPFQTRAAPPPSGGTPPK